MSWSICKKGVHSRFLKICLSLNHGNNIMWVQYNLNINAKLNGPVFLWGSSFVSAVCLVCPCVCVRSASGVGHWLLVWFTMTLSFPRETLCQTTQRWPPCSVSPRGATQNQNQIKTQKAASVRQVCRGFHQSNVFTPALIRFARSEGRTKLATVGTR